jgi:inosine/xanthosine triphosphatase
MGATAKIVVIASENPVKVAVAKKAFALVFPDKTFTFVPVRSVSGVPDQPYGAETRQGARNRLAYIQELHPEADYWVSQEGGVFVEGERLYNRVFILIADREGYVGESSTARFFLPTQIAEAVKAGAELGHATDAFFDKRNSKQGIGAVGYLTDGLVDRERYYTEAAIIALSEVKHKEWYQ